MWNKENGTGNDDFTLLDDEFACIRSQGIIERNRDHRKHATCLLCKHPLQQEHKHKVNYQWNIYEFVLMKSLVLWIPNWRQGIIIRILKVLLSSDICLLYKITKKCLKFVACNFKFLRFDTKCQKIRIKF